MKLLSIMDLHIFISLSDKLILIVKRDKLRTYICVQHKLLASDTYKLVFAKRNRKLDISTRTE